MIDFLKITEDIILDSSYYTFVRVSPEKGNAMPIIINYNGENYMLSEEYFNKYMNDYDFDTFYRKRSDKELIDDNVYVKYSFGDFIKICNNQNND